MKTLYFDQNIIIDIKNKRKPDLVKTVENINTNHFQILFSPAHIEEIAALKMHHGEDENNIHEFLDFLALITKSKALLPYKINNTVQVKRTGVYISNEHPRTTYLRVIAGYNYNSIAEDHQKEKISNGKNFEMASGLTSREANNFIIQREIDIFKPRLYQIIHNKFPSFDPVFSKYLPTRAPACHEINFENLGMYFPLHEMTIEKIFEFLEVMRYFPDKSTQFLSGLHDITHATYAAYCDVFVTNDRRLKNKAAATYKWLGINTLILNPQELIDYLSN